MPKRFDLEIMLTYSLKGEYSRLVKWHEWVRGFPVKLLMSVKNKSGEPFPQTGVKVLIHEYGQSIGVQPLAWETTVGNEIPLLEAGGSATVALVEFEPLFEGVCKIILEVAEPADSEVWITGWRSPQPRRKELLGYFIVVPWQELEILDLLSKLQKGE